MDKRCFQHSQEFLTNSHLKRPEHSASSSRTRQPAYRKNAFHIGLRCRHTDQVLIKPCKSCRTPCVPEFKSINTKNAPSLHFSNVCVQLRHTDSIKSGRRWQLDACTMEEVRNTNSFETNGVEHLNLLQTTTTGCSSGLWSCWQCRRFTCHFIIIWKIMWTETFKFILVFFALFSSFSPAYYTYSVKNVKEQAVQEAATICPAPCKLTFDLESGVRVTCDVAYLCANFSLPRPLCSWLRPDACDRQTDVRQTDVQCESSLNASALWGRGIISTTGGQIFYPSDCTYWWAQMI